MRWVEGRIEKSETIAAPIERLRCFISSIERLAEIFPGAESIRSDGENTIWVLEEQGAAGISVRPRATTRLRLEEPARLRIEDAHGGEDTAHIHGVVEFIAEESDLTRMTASVEIAIALPIPFFAVPIARSITQGRIDRIADRLLMNVRRAAEGGTSS